MEEYLSTFTITLGQMEANIAYMGHLGFIHDHILGFINFLQLMYLLTNFLHFSTTL